MDVHRCRFVPYPQSSITALAFSQSHITKFSKAAPPRLAVGRANGDIEIWNPQNGSWHQELVIRGGKDRSIDGLTWIQEPNETDSKGQTIIGRLRLFSVGCTTTLTEWDLERGIPLRHANGNHGEIWCLAAQPALTTAAPKGAWAGQNIIVGCTDGALVLYSTADDNLQFDKLLVRSSTKKARILSVAFQDRNVVISGCTDSNIRVFDIRNGKNLRIMSLGAGPSGGPKNIDVWAVKALPNGDIVSGDSTGELRIWNGKRYTLKQRLNSHKQDIFTLAVSADGSTIFSGGKDRRSVVYKQNTQGNRWAEVAHQRYHDHDVTTMASLEQKGMSVVVSGGPDAAPTVVPLQQYGMEDHRALPFLQQDPPIRGALMGTRRLLMAFWDREVHIWEVPDPRSLTTMVGSDGVTPENRKLVAKILIKGEANITSADLSEDGRLLVVATPTDIKLFQLRPRVSEELNRGLKISKVNTPRGFASGARLVQLSPDANWLCIVRADSRILLRRLEVSSSSITIHPHITKLDRLDRSIPKSIRLGGHGNYTRSVTQVAFSSDSRILAASDLAGYIDTFVLFGSEDLSQRPTAVEEDAASSDDSSDSDEEGVKTELTFGQYWTGNPSASSIPKLPSAPTVLSFRPSTKTSSNGVTSHVIATRHNPKPTPHDLPSSEDRLLVVTATTDIFEFEVLKGGLSAWSRRNPTSSFPPKFRRIRDLAKGCFWDTGDDRERLWLYGVNWIYMFDLAVDFPEYALEEAQLASSEAASREITNGSLKRKRGGKVEASGAGSIIPDEKLGHGISRKMRRIIQDGEITEEGDLLRSRSRELEQLDDDEEADVDSDDDQALERLPRENGEKSVDVTRDGCWETFKYRPILGICVLNARDDNKIGPEVAIVERPLWEADLPDRYYGNQEWDKLSS